MKLVSEIGRGSGSSMETSGSSLPKISRAAVLSRAASILSLATICGLVACNRDFTLSYLYAPSETASTSGLINVYGIDNQTGALHLLADSPVPSGGRKPVAIAAAPNEHAIYVINHDDSNVVEFSIGTDGKLYPRTPTTRREAIPRRSLSLPTINTCMSLIPIRLASPPRAPVPAAFQPSRSTVITVWARQLISQSGAFR